MGGLNRGKSGRSCRRAGLGSAEPPAPLTGTAPGWGGGGRRRRSGAEDPPRRLSPPVPPRRCPGWGGIWPLPGPRRGCHLPGCPRAAGGQPPSPGSRRSRGRVVVGAAAGLRCLLFCARGVICSGRILRDVFPFLPFLSWFMWVFSWKHTPDKAKSLRNSRHRPPLSTPRFWMQTQP